MLLMATKIPSQGGTSLGVCLCVADVMGFKPLKALTFGFKSFYCLHTNKGRRSDFSVPVERCWPYTSRKYAFPNSQITQITMQQKVSHFEAQIVVTFGAIFHEKCRKMMGF